MYIINLPPSPVTLCQNFLALIYQTLEFKSLTNMHVYLSILKS